MAHPRGTALAAALTALASVVQFPVHDQAVPSACAYGLLLIGMTVSAVALLRAPDEPGLATAATGDSLVTSAPSTR